MQATEVRLRCGPEVMTDIERRELVPEQVGGDQLRSDAAGYGVPVAVHSERADKCLLFSGMVNKVIT